MNFFLLQQEALAYAAMATRWREPPKDALDALILQSLDAPTVLEKYSQLSYTPFDPVSKRTQAEVTLDNGEDKQTSFKVAKVR